MFLIFTLARSQLENDPGPLPEMHLPPGCACIITESQLDRKNQ